jgi:hypothetical protein
LNQEVNIHETQQAGHAIEGDLDPIIFNPVGSTTLKSDVQTSEVGAKLATVSVAT